MKFLIVIFFIIISVQVIAQNNLAVPPKNIVLSTADLDNFWQLIEALPGAKSKEDSLALLATHYLDKASPCLKEILTMEQQQNGKNIQKEYLALLNQYPRYFSSLKKNIKSIEQQKEKIHKAYEKLMNLYSTQNFPPVYLAFGIFNTGSTTKDCGLYIGAEMHLLTKQTDLSEFTSNTWWLNDFDVQLEYLADVVVHEQIHSLQHLKLPRTLLDQAITEGGADFITKLITGKTAGLDEKAHEYGNKYLHQLWEEFAKDMYKEDIYSSKWFFNPTQIELPMNMGYFLGYKVAEAYYNNSSDKRRAVTEIIETTDSKFFLERSQFLQKLK